ncbi:MAG: AMP-dependent synthetase/ligase [Kiloniellales bacterium]
MENEAWQSLAALFLQRAEQRKGQPFLWAKRDGLYQPRTWNETCAAVKELSRGLRSLGLERGERVVLVSENRPEWLIADLAIVAAGAVTVPAYTTNTPADHEHILGDSGAVGAIVSTQALARRLLPAAIKAPACKWLISIDAIDYSQASTIDLHRWDEIIERGRGLPDDVAEVVSRAKRDDLACIIYTSGTGGAPKGVMLSHANILSNCNGAYHLLSEFGLGREVFLSFLPLSHSYEHTAGQYFPISIGAQIYYAEGVEQLLTNLGEARPTIMTAVPRLYEIMHQRILRGVEKQGGLKKTLFERTLELGRKRYFDPKSLTLGERLVDWLLDRLVRNKMRQRFGGRLKGMVSGGAALNPDIGIFFTALGLPVLQGYGQTEASPVVAANRPGKVKMHTVGPPLESVEVRIAEDGEILVRGELVMKGYWRDDEATAAAIQDGWLHTGDIGEFDGGGYLKITDRKKDIIVLSGGDNVSPARIESLLTLEPEIAQAMVFGDRRPHLVALIVPDEEFVLGWARQSGKPADRAALVQDEDFHAAVAAVVDRVNQRLSSLEKLRRFAIAKEAFTIENEMMTPTLKLRRHVIKGAYGDVLERLYQRG